VLLQSKGPQWCSAVEYLHSSIIVKACLSAAPNSSLDTRRGPRGAKLSKDLLEAQCGIGPALSDSLCQSQVMCRRPRCTRQPPGSHHRVDIAAQRNARGIDDQHGLFDQSGARPLSPYASKLKNCSPLLDLLTITHVLVMLSTSFKISLYALTG
jgi:hypothetical protein